MQREWGSPGISGADRAETPPETGGFHIDGPVGGSPFNCWMVEFMENRKDDEIKINRVAHISGNQQVCMTNFLAIVFWSLLSGEVNKGGSIKQSCAF